MISAATRLLSIAIVEVINPLLIISIAIYVSVGYILSLLMPVTIDIWVAVFWMSLLLSLIALLFRVYLKWNLEQRAGLPFSWKSMLHLVPLIVILPAVLAEFAHPNMQILNHGDIHAAFIHQLLNDSTPIENAFLAGYPVGYHWLFNAVYASVVQITGISPPTVSSLMNVIAMLSSFVWIGKTGVANSVDFRILL